MRNAALAFVSIVLDEYKVWQCEAVKTVKIDVKEWVKKNTPEWEYIVWENENKKEDNDE